ncbi:MAG: hypothetical protein KUG77_16550 [Nannocystaceae bacterium]|nr:hypothetical protein [Nannocystaceae bacterium]
MLNPRLIALPLLTGTLLMGCDGGGTATTEDGTTGEATTGADTQTVTPTASTTNNSSTGEGSTTQAPTTGEETSSSSGGETGDSSGETGLPHECDLDEPGTCVDEMTAQVCEDVDGLRQWVELECAEDSTCLGGGCASAIQQEFITQLRSYLDGVQAGTAVAADVDWEDLHEQAATLVVAGDDSADTLYRAARALQLQIPQGHQWVRFGPDLCGVPEGMSYTQQTFYGACSRISEDGVIVTAADESNPLGLLPGDRIVGSNRWDEGADFLAQIAAEPLCSSLTPSNPNALRRQAAAQIFGLLDEGDSITVLDPDGESREVEVPARLGDDPIGWCNNPLEGGYSSLEAVLTMRPDGVAVIRVAHFGSSENPFPSPLTVEAYYQWVSDYVDRLAGILSTIPTDAPIIWDARSNSGGASEVPMAIIAGMPGANRTQISEGYQRIADSDPFEFYKDALSTFSFEIPEDDRLNHNAPTAVLVDFGTTSAADFFAWGAGEFSDALVVGTPGTANYGYGGGPGAFVEGSVGEFTYRIDPIQSRAMDGAPLEGMEVVPDILVEYDPADLAGGVDTVLEAAADALLE